jgi:hypothetical protein
MRKARVLLILGIWLTALPYLGFPNSWKNALTVLSGLGLIWFSYLLYREYKKREVRNEIFDNFSENNFFNENEEVAETTARDISELNEEEI